MGQLASREPAAVAAADRERQEDTAAQEIAVVARHTHWSKADITEYHEAFVQQYPSGIVDRATFIAENMEVNGGPAELWAHVFRLVGLVHPLSATDVHRRFVRVDEEQPEGSSRNAMSARRRSSIRDMEGGMRLATNHTTPPTAAPPYAEPNLDEGMRLRRDEFDEMDNDVGNNRTGADNIAHSTAPFATGPPAGFGKRTEYSADQVVWGEDVPSSEPLDPVVARRVEEKQQRAAAAVAAPSSSSPHAGTRTSYVSVPPELSEGDAVGMNFSHVMLRLYRAQYQPAERKLKYLFALFDLRGNGAVGEEELTTVLEWVLQLRAVTKLDLYHALTDEEKACPRIRARAILVVLDRDHDGKLTQEEFIEGCRRETTLLAVLSILKV